MFALKDAELKRLLEVNALDRSRNMQMPRHRRCRDTVGLEYTATKTADGYKRTLAEHEHYYAIRIS